MGIVYSINSEACTLTLSRTKLKPLTFVQDLGTRNSGSNPGSGVNAVGASPESACPQVQLVFLLPDGRWQVLELPHLKVQLPDLRNLDSWRRNLALHCNSATLTGSARQA